MRIARTDGPPVQRFLVDVQSRQEIALIQRCSLLKRVGRSLVNESRERQYIEINRGGAQCHGVVLGSENGRRGDTEGFSDVIERLTQAAPRLLIASFAP
jgi:hypothetical protein